MRSTHGFNKYLGRLITRLFPDWADRLMGDWNDPYRSRLGRVLSQAVMASWADIYLALGPDEREITKERWMGGQAGVRWAEHYQAQPIDFDQPVGSMAYRDACPLLLDLHWMLERREPTLVVQIGCSSGREIAWLAERNGRHLFIGTDPFPEVIEVAERSHRLPNLLFRVASTKTLSSIGLEGPDRPTIFFSSGSLQYVQPEHVALLFKQFANRSDLELWLLEPANLPLKVGASEWQGNFAFSHNYRFYAQAAGWGTIFSEIIRPYSGPTVHYYYAATTNPPRRKYGKTVG